MADVKKNICDDRIAVRQLVSHIYLAGTARACQRKLLVESSVGSTSNITNCCNWCEWLFDGQSTLLRLARTL